MSNGLAGIAEGLRDQLNANAHNQIAVALSAINLVLDSLELNHNWGTTIVADGNQYYLDMLLSMGKSDDKNENTQYAIAGVQDNLKKTNDMNRANLEAGNLSNLIETQKSQAQAAGASLQKGLQTQTPITALLTFTSLLLTRIK